MELKLWGYVYSQSSEGGTTTQIECVNRNAFAVAVPTRTWMTAGIVPGPRLRCRRRLRDYANLVSRAFAPLCEPRRQMAKAD